MKKRIRAGVPKIGPGKKVGFKPYNKMGGKARERGRRDTKLRANPRGLGLWPHMAYTGTSGIVVGIF